MSEKIEKDWKKIKDESLLQEEQDRQELDEAEQLDDAKSALDHPSYTDLEEKLTKAEQQAHENWEKSVRAMAELENVRRRAERDVSNAHRYGPEKLINALLPAVDSLEQARQLAEQHSDKSMQEGLELTLKLILDVFQKNEVQQLDPLGEMFDPQQHEAMTTQESADVAHNTVLTVIQKGYKLYDRVIRPARVIVAKGKN